MIITSALFISQNCFKCDEQLYQIINNQKNGCDCKKGYFKNNSQPFECKQCPTGCDECDAQKCSKCISGYFQDRKQNGCDCIQGYFQDAGGKCQQCQDGCNDCNNTKCNSCSDGYFLDVQTNQCSKCMDNCLKCTFKDQCIQWKKCGQGKYLDKITNQCQICHAKCKSCFGPNENNCRECFNQLFVNEAGQCTECEVGQYKSKENNKCINCHWSCKECNGPQENNCLTCQSSLQLSFNFKCLSDKEIKNEEDEKIICKYSGFYLNDNECNQNLDYAKQMNYFVDKLSLINLVLAFIITIFVPIFSPFTWFYIQQQQLLGNFALLKSMSFMWINQLQLKISFGYNIINNFSNQQQKREDLIYDFSLFDEFVFETNGVYKIFVQNTLVHASIFIIIIVIFGLLMILKYYSAFAEKVLSYIQWNLFIRFFMISSNFLTLSAIIEFQQGSFSNITSLVIFVVLGVFYLLFQIKSLRFLFSYDYYLRFFDKNNLVCLKNGLIDTQRLPRLFWLIFEVRKITSCVLLFIFKDTTYASWIILGLSTAQIIYVVIQKPLIDKKANILLLVLELLFAFVTIFISLQNQFILQEDFSEESKNIFIAKIITGGLLAIQVFCLISLIYISIYSLINIILKNKNDRLKNSLDNSHLIIEQNFKFESFDQIITALQGSNKSISWTNKPNKI